MSTYYHIGTFKEIAGTAYTVKIGDDALTADAALTLAADPLAISMQPGENKFPGTKPVQCTIRVVTDSDLSSLYSDTPMGTPVHVLRGNTVIFTGYLVPMSFSQPLSGVADTVELTAVDCITALRYTDYTMRDPDTGAGIYSILDYVCKACAIAGNVQHIRAYSAAFESPGNPDSYPWENKYVSEDAFLPVDHDDIEARLSWLDVVRTLAGIFTYTAVMIGDTLWLIPYNNLKGSARLSQKIYTRGDAAWSYYTTSTYAYADVPIEAANILGPATLTIIPARSRIRLYIDRWEDIVPVQPMTDRARYRIGGSLTAWNYREAGVNGYVFNRKELTGKDYMFRRYTGAGVLCESLDLTPFTGGNLDGDDWMGAAAIQMSYYDSAMQNAPVGSSGELYIWVRQMAYSAVTDRTTKHATELISMAATHCTPDCNIVIQGSAFCQNTGAWLPDIAGGGSPGVFSVWCYCRSGSVWWDGTAWSSNASIFQLSFGGAGLNGFRDVIDTAPGSCAERGYYIPEPNTPGPLVFGLAIYPSAADADRNVWVKDLRLVWADGNPWLQEPERERTQELNNTYGDTLDVSTGLWDWPVNRRYAQNANYNTLSVFASQYAHKKRSYRLLVKYSTGVEAYSRVSWNGTIYTVDSYEWLVRDGSNNIGLIE